MVFGRFTGGKSFKQSSKHVFLFLTLHKQHFTNGWSLQNNMLFVCVLQNGSFDYSVSVQQSMWRLPHPPPPPPPVLEVFGRCCLGRAVGGGGRARGIPALKLPRTWLSGKCPARFRQSGWRGWAWFARGGEWHAGIWSTGRGVTGRGEERLLSCAEMGEVGRHSKEDFKYLCGPLQELAGQKK